MARIAGLWYKMNSAPGPRSLAMYSLNTVFFFKPRLCSYACPSNPGLVSGREPETPNDFVQLFAPKSQGEQRASSACTSVPKHSKKLMRLGGSGMALNTEQKLRAIL